MCDYTGELEDAHHFSSIDLPEDEINEATKKLLGETRDNVALLGYLLFI